jgi:tRNA (guanine26-N2/guanine27-N2)-dimethyltransferase
VFYNPAMAGDRDLGVAFVRARFEGGPGERTGWEVTAATGVRGLRLLHEGERFARFRLTEAHPEAAAVLARNAQRYPGAVAERGDGREPPDDAPYDYVDVDPYGTPAPFVPTAIGAVRPGGVLAVTATDMMVLAGVQRGAAERRYGGRPVRGRLGPEGGLRVLLAYLDREARSLGRSLEPLMCYTRDHHVRAYVALPSLRPGTATAPVGTIEPARWDGPFLGDHGPYGPLWLGPLFDPELVRRLAAPPTPAAPEECARFLLRLREEVEADVPFYYEPNRLAHDLGLATPPGIAGLLAALRSDGFRAARTHARPEGFRTDAPRVEVERRARAEATRGQSQNARVRA